jgi:hypothetical protein
MYSCHMYTQFRLATDLLKPNYYVSPGVSDMIKIIQGQCAYVNQAMLIFQSGTQV